MATPDERWSEIGRLRPRAPLPDPPPDPRWAAMARTDAARLVRVPYEYLRFQRARWITLVGRLGFEIAELTRLLTFRVPEEYNFFHGLADDVRDAIDWCEYRSAEAQQVADDVGELLVKILAWYESNESTATKMLDTVAAETPLPPPPPDRLEWIR